MKRILVVLLGLLIVTADCQAGKDGPLHRIGRALFGKRESPGRTPDHPGGDSRVPSPGPSAPFLEDFKTFPKHVQSAAILSTVTMGGGGCTGCIVGWERKQDRDYWIYVLTAAHCVGKDGRRVRVGLVWRDGQKRPGSSSTRKEVIGHTVRGDVALIKFVRKRNEGIPNASPIRSDMPSMPFDVLSLGTDQSRLPWMWSGKVLKAGRSRTRDGSIDALSWTVNRQPSGGRSGGPLFDTSGQVVGVCSTGGRGKGEFIHLKEIQSLCDKAGVSWLYKSSPYVPPERGPDPGIIIAPKPTPKPKLPILPIGYYERVPIWIDCQPGRA